MYSLYDNGLEFVWSAALCGLKPTSSLSVPSAIMLISGNME